MTQQSLDYGIDRALDHRKGRNNIFRNSIRKKFLYRYKRIKNNK